MNQKRKNQANAGQKIVGADVLLDAMVDAVSVVGIDGNILQCNKAHSEMFGYSVEETIGMNVSQFVTQHELETAGRAIKKSFETKDTTKNIESTGLTKDGREFPMLINSTVLKDSDGNPVALITNLRDITELKKAQEQAQKAAANEAAAREAEAGKKKLKTYLESMIDGVGVTDMRGNLVQGNTAVAKMHGYESIEQMIGKSVTMFTKKTDIPKVLPAIKQCWEKGVIRDLQLTHITKDGKEFPVSLNAAALKDGKGEIVGTVAAIRDITERKLTEKMLWESQERYRAIMNNTALGITIMDTNHKIIMTNATFAQLFRKSPSDFVGKYCFREYEHREAICPHCPGVRAMASGKTAEVETYTVLEDGSRVDTRNRAIPLFGSDGVVKGFIEMVENITERKKAEEELQKGMEQLERFNRLAIGRESRIIELKRQVNDLLAELGREHEYRSVENKAKK